MDHFTKPLTVSDLTNQIKTLVEIEFSDLSVTGEISNLTRHSSGHLYFTLKDARSEISVVMFRGNNQFLRFTPEHGMQVTISGNISMYEQRGRLQLIARSMEPAGVGTLYMAYEALKKKLEEAGLFDPVTKKPLRDLPKSIGVISSPTGAAVKDIMQVLERRAPYATILFRPTLVQGGDAAPDIVQALTEMNQLENLPDVLILGRGGGSLEDLWAFNEEPVVRAIHNSKIPIISAVGHETDITLSDLASDLRAPTPSAAAELAAVSKSEILNDLVNKTTALERTLESRINNLWQILDSFSERIEFLKPQKQIQRNRESVIHALSVIRRNFEHRLIMEHSTLNGLTTFLHKNIQYRYEKGKASLDSLKGRLGSLNPESILDRGYSIAFAKASGKVIKAGRDLKTNDEFILRTGKGSFEAIKKNDLEQ